MATHSSILIWRIPWTEEPVGLLSVGLQRVGHNCAIDISTFIHIYTYMFEIYIYQIYIFPFLNIFKDEIIFFFFFNLELTSGSPSGKQETE